MTTSCYAFAFLLCISGALAESCDKLISQAEFDPPQLLGTWNLIDFEGPKVEEELKCCATEISLIRNTKYLYAVFQGLAPDGSTLTIIGNGTVSDPSVPGKLAVYYDNVPYTFYIVKTDYTNFFLSVLCTKQNEVNRVFIQSRSHKLDDSLIKSLKDTLQQQGVDISKIVASNQDFCA